MASFTLLPTGESSDLAEDLRLLVADIAPTLAHARQVYAADCPPALDLVETGDALAVIVDVSGEAPVALRVLARNGVPLVAGETALDWPAGPQTVHRVERECGRCARPVRISGAFDVARAEATGRDGELTVRLPRVSNRRGPARRIPVTWSAQERAQA